MDNSIGEAVNKVFRDKDKVFYSAVNIEDDPKPNTKVKLHAHMDKVIEKIGNEGVYLIIGGKNKK